MFKLDRKGCEAAYSDYRTCEAFFPLIGAVLLGEQNGVIYADHPALPKQMYVEHAFGFAQVFGVSVPSFESALKKYLLEDKWFFVAKVRLYTPLLLSFLRSTDYDNLRSERQRCVFDPAGAAFAMCSSLELPANVTVSGVNTGNVALVESRFGVVGRFWRSAQDFIAKSHAAVAFIDGQMASICYAAAVVNNRAEIDVLTLPEYRHLGLGKFVVTHFNQECLECDLQPMWDCFSNNSGSVALGGAVGFIPARTYPFYTINP